MRCPKCGLEQSDANTECLRCGLIFSRYRPPSQRPTPKPAPPGRLKRTIEYLLPDDGGQPAFIVLKGVFLLLLLLWSLRFLGASIESNYVGRSFMHLVNLPFHEAGHLVFRPFGRIMHSLGGSLGQVIMPLTCALVLLVKTRDPFGASVALWWTGESVLDIAPYINDARRMTLQLLGGNTGAAAPYGFHDWNFILTELGALSSTRRLAQAVGTAGKSLMVLALLWGASVLLRQALSTARSS